MIVSVVFTLAILRPISFHLNFEIKGVISIWRKNTKWDYISISSSFLLSGSYKHFFHRCYDNSHEELLLMRNHLQTKKRINL